jgi:ABC-type uncharacterized transport system permease subunit
MKLDFFINIGTGVAIRSSVFPVILTVLLAYTVFTGRFCQWTRKFVLCEMELKSEVEYTIWTKVSVKGVDL